MEACAEGELEPHPPPIFPHAAISSHLRACHLQAHAATSQILIAPSYMHAGAGRQQPLASGRPRVHGRPDEVCARGAFAISLQYLLVLLHDAFMHGGHAWGDDPVL